jgi:hypothetical protein
MAPLILEWHRQFLLFEPGSISSLASAPCSRTKWSADSPIAPHIIQSSVSADRHPEVRGAGGNINETQASYTEIVVQHGLDLSLRHSILSIEVVTDTGTFLPPAKTSYLHPKRTMVCH